MNKIYPIFTVILFAVFVTGCKKSIDTEAAVQKQSSGSDLQQNPMNGIVFSDIAEIPELKGYVLDAGSVIDNIGKRPELFKYTVAQYSNNKNHLIILKELIKVAGSPKVKYKILDTLLTERVKQDEYLVICTCRLNGIDDTEIIAVVKADDDKAYYDVVVKAWRADTQSEKIVPITALNGIDCINIGFGMDGDGEAEDSESEITDKDGGH